MVITMGETGEVGPLYSSFEIDKPEIMTTEVLPAGAPELARLRQEIDNVDHDKAQQEAEKFANHEGGRAAIFALVRFGTAVGYAEVKSSEDLPENSSVEVDTSEYGHLARIGVSKDSREMGVGKKLIKSAEDWAQKQGKSGLWLEYLNENEPARRLYEKSGYKIIGKFYDEMGKHRIIVAKEFSTMFSGKMFSGEK